MGACHTYNVYGLSLQVPFVCAGLSPGDPDRSPDVVVVDAELPEFLVDPEIRGDGFDAAPGRLLLRFGRLSGRFLIENGRLVTVQRSPMAQDAALGFHLANSVMAAVMRQRGYLVMHASVAARGNSAVLLTGVSGAGKSTTLAALCARGWSILSDDVAVLQRSPEGEILVLPGVPQVSLFEHTAKELDLDIEGYPLYPWRRMKALISVPPPVSSQPVPLRRIFILELGRKPSLESETVQGAQRFSLVSDCLYGPIIPSEYAGLLPLQATLANQIPIVSLRRPSQCWSVDEVVAQIANDVFPFHDMVESGGVAGNATEG